MSEISKINFSLGNIQDFKNKDVAKKEEQKEEVKNPSNEETTKVDSNKILDAMALNGKNNASQLKFSMINPRDYLSEDRIKAIQESMGVFESGVQKQKEAFEEEFGKNPLFSHLDEASKLELSARSLAKIQLLS